MDINDINAKPNSADTVQGSQLLYIFTALQLASKVIRFGCVNHVRATVVMMHLHCISVALIWNLRA